MAITDEDYRRPCGMTMEPLALPIPEAQRVSGLSRSAIYRRLATGDIQAVKSGSRTLILTDSLRTHMASLPAATYRAPKGTTSGRLMIDRKGQAGR